MGIRKTLVALSVLLLAGTLAACAAGQSPKPSFTQGIQTNQQRWPEAFRFALDLTSLVYQPTDPTHEASDFGGFGSVVPQLRDGSVDVYWHGNPPPAYFSLIEKQPTSLPIRLHQAPYSFAELSRHLDAAFSLSHSSAIGFANVIEASVLPDCSGIEVVIDSRAVAAMSSTERYFSEKIHVPVSVTFGSRPIAVSQQ